MKEKKIMRISGLLAISVLFIFSISCISGNKTPSALEAPVGITGPGEAKENWQIEWEKVVSQAQREKTVVIYTTLGSETTTQLRQAFKNRFGVEAEFVGGRGGEVAQKILMERRAGLYLVDLYVGGANTAIVIIKPAKAFDPIEPALLLPEVTDLKMWREG